jgi:hypothetical protein
VKRPAWAAAGCFASAWAGCGSNASLLREMSMAHVLTIEKDQMDALPYIAFEGSGFGGLLRSLRLPFDPLFIDLGQAKLHNYYDDAAARCALVATSPSGLQLCVWAAPRRGASDAAEILFRGWHPIAFVEPAGDNQLRIELLRTAGSKDSQRILDLVKDDLGEIARQVAERAVAALYWLESVNVDLAEAPLSPRQRARELNKGRRIALTVAVRAPKSKRPVGQNGRVNYSHRFEVRGHYMHFPEGTRLADADPTKLSFVPGRGFVRKVWCPPHVKGPQDKPLIPKVRVVA